MIITRTPFRVSFVGGGSDLRSFYSRHPGCVISVTINKYMYLSVHKYFDSEQIHVRYNKVELVNSVDEVKHPIVREALRLLRSQGGIEITSTADVPAGTGLGSSSSFAVGILHCLYASQGIFVSKERLGKEASEIEIDILKEPIGKQDHYAAAFGGFNCIRFYPDERVTVEPILTDLLTRKYLEERLMLFYLGGIRSAASILHEQYSNTYDQCHFESLVHMAELAEKLRESLWQKRFDDFGDILHKAWILKRTLASGISNPRINLLYDRALKAGALGGKLLGAGGNGFMLIYSPPERQQHVCRELAELKAFPFKFDMEGSRVIYVGES